jgi:hypothetical protein
VIHLEAQAEGARRLTHNRLDFSVKPDDFAAFVVAAFRAHAMRHARLLTIRAGLGLRRTQCIMRTAFAGARFGMSSFGIRHNNSFK